MLKITLALRILYGIGLIAAPERIATRWLGPGASRAPVQVPLRALGMREVLLHTGAMAAALRGGNVRPWLAATIAGRDELPSGAAPATAVVAGASAAVSAALIKL